MAASRDENADYKITRNHIKLLLVVTVLFRRNIKEKKNSFYQD